MTRSTPSMLALSIVLGAAAFLVSAIAHQLVRGLEDSVLLSGTGSPVTTVSGWTVWVVGAVVLVLAVVAGSVALVRRPSRWWWLGFGVTVAALLLAGTVAGMLGPVAPVDGAADRPPVLLTWLVDGASEPLAWALAGVALLPGMRRRAMTPTTRG